MTNTRILWQKSACVGSVQSSFSPSCCVHAGSSLLLVFLRDIARFIDLKIFTELDFIATCSTPLYYNIIFQQYGVFSS